MKSLRISLAIATCVALSGCDFAPKYVRPQTQDPHSFKEAAPAQPPAGDWKPADPRDAQIRSNWWEVFADPQLNELEEKVVISNQSVAVAEANYRAARALVAEAEAAFFPTVTLDPSAVRSRSSASVSTLGGSLSTTGTGISGTTPPSTTTTTTNSKTIGGSTSPRTIYSVPVEASYQVDLWGSVRNSVAQNRFSAQASAAQVATALLSTQSQLAQDYFELRVTDELRRILDATVTDYEASVHLVTTLVKYGMDSSEDLSEAETQLHATQAQATDLGIARAQYEHAIAVLIGLPPADFSIPYRRLNQSLPAVPVGLPSDLLERRPDIATAERQVAASNAAIGIARAAFFPSLTLSAEAGYESTGLKHLFDWPNRIWSLGPELAQTLFDGGAKRAAEDQAIALNDQAAATYRQTVLTAFQAVEDNLASLRILAQESGQQHDATVAAQHTVQLSVVRYRNGVDSYVNVITAQNAFLNSRQADMQIQLRQLIASVNLINNLGGGWSTAKFPQTEQLAMHRSGADAANDSEKSKAPAEDAGTGIPNPPPLPARDVRPEDILKQDEATMSTDPSGSGPQP
jgi:NodT family efflux transporter outer membrane factor (OMF) lipoprotein